VSALLAWTPVAAAQETRTTEPQLSQSPTPETQLPVKPSQNRFERAARKLKSLGLFGRTSPGLYPEVTTIYPGGWLALGGGYRHDLARIDYGSFDVNAAWSLRNFKEVTGKVSLPVVTNEEPRVMFDVEANWMDAPAVAFYGVGEESRADKTTFGYRPTTVGMTLRMTPAFVKGMTVAGGVDYIAIDPVTALEGAADIVGTIGRVSGMASGPRYLRSRVRAEFDSRPSDRYDATGGVYRFAVADYSDRNGSHLAFRSAEVDVVQLVPVVRRHSIALRGLATVTDDSDGDDVPFYLMPSLGGNSSVRGYPSFRFRGNHRLLLSVEYRWAVARVFDLAMFYDAGKVAMDLDRLNLRDLKSAYGIGGRFHTSRRTVLRVEAARNDESAWRFIFSTGAAF
jgi:hypothetical protein